MVLNGILFRERTGVPWMDLPERCGPWQTVYNRFRRCSLDGTWDRVLDHVVVKDDAVGAVGWEASIDSSIVRAHQHAAGAPVLRFERHTTADIDHATERIRTVDGLLLPHGFLPNLPHTVLYTDDWVCLVATSNPHVGETLTMELLSELPWVFTYHAPAAFTPAGRQLQVLGVEPRVQIVVDSFLALPFAIAGTDRIGLVQRRLAPKLTAAGDVRALECPFDAVAITEVLWWHPMYERDPAHIWLRALLADASSRLAVATPATPARPPSLDG